MRVFNEKRITKPRKSYFNVGERQKMKARAELWDYYNLISSDYERRFGLKIKKIELIDQTRSLNTKLDLVILSNNETLTNKHIDIYKTKEETYLSDRSFQKFFDSGANFPTLFTVKKYQLRLNNVFKIFSNTKGFYFNPEEKISFYLSIFHNHIEIKDNILYIRLAADGTRIGRNLNVFNISFSILNKIQFPLNKSKN